MTNILTEKRVRRGMAWLTRKRGSDDWMCKIDLERLDIANGMSCILGQTYGSYSLGTEVLGIQLSRSFLVSLGFLLSLKEVGKRILTEEWKRQLTKACQ